MKFLIKENFNLKLDMLTATDVRKIKYDIGDLKKILSQKHEYYFELFTTNTIHQQKKNKLIYLIDFSHDSLDHLLSIRFNSKNCFYYVADLNGPSKAAILDHLQENGIQELDFITYFKKSSLVDWKIEIKSNPQLNLECVVLNIFLSLGAQLVSKFPSTMVIQDNLSLEKVLALSFQHGIKLYKMK
jgi:hypothetical protein